MKRRLTGILITAYNCLKGIYEDIGAKLSYMPLNSIARATIMHCSSEGSGLTLGKPSLPGGQYNTETGPERGGGISTPGGFKY